MVKRKGLSPTQQPFMASQTQRSPHQLQINLVSEHRPDLFLTGTATNHTATFRAAPSTLHSKQRSFGPTTVENTSHGDKSPRETTALERSYNRQNTNTTDQSDLKSGDTNANDVSNMMPTAVALDDRNKGGTERKAVTVSQLMRLMNKDINFADVNPADEESDADNSIQGVQSECNEPTTEIISVSIFDKCRRTEDSFQASTRSPTPKEHDYQKRETTMASTAKNSRTTKTKLEPVKK